MDQLGKAKRLALLAVLAAVPLAANATAITYDFTGTVTSTTGIYADAGPTVTGSITLNLSNGNAAQSSSGGPNLLSDWNVDAYGGPLVGTALPSALVVTFVVDSGGVKYTS